MQITIFKELTTEEALKQFTDNGKKYTGLVVDMDDPDQRRFVKSESSEIKSLIKKVDRHRIDEKKRLGDGVDKEAFSIIETLEEANKPYTLLEDAYKKERTKILAEKKAIEDAEALAIQIEDDHELAIMQNKVFDIEKQEQALERLKRDEALKAEAIKHAEEEKQRIIEQAKKDAEQAEINKKLAVEAEAERQKKLAIDAENKAKAEENARLANIKHVTSICTGVKLDLINNASLTEQLAIAVVKAIRSNLISNTIIKF